MLAEKQKQFFMEHVRGKRNPRITGYFLEAYLKNLSCAPILREARALYALWESAEILVYPEEQVVGSLFASEVCIFHYSSGVTLDEERLQRYAVQQGRGEAWCASVRDQVWSHCYLYPEDPAFEKYHGGLYREEELAAVRSTAAGCTWFGGHMVMDYEKILKIGLDGYAKEIASLRLGAQDPAFYEAMDTVLQGLQIFIRRTAVECERVMEVASTPELKRNMQACAAALRHVERRPPDTFREALQLVMMVHLAVDCDSFGRFDYYLRPFYERDIAAGVLTREMAFELLKSAVIKIEQFDAIQNLTLGGTTPDGGENYIELTELILLATKEMGFKGPNLSLRVTKDMPQRFWQLAISCLASGQGLPALYNDEVIVPLLLENGFVPEDARDYCLAGCSQIVIGGKSQFVNDIGMMNIAKILELTLYNGCDRVFDGEQVGPETGEDFADFDQLLSAFYQQIDYFVPIEASINNKDILLRGKMEGYALRSLFTRGCLESGRGIFSGGARYNAVQMECIGITNTADSLYAVQQAVYQEGRCSFAALRDALRSDFCGSEDLWSYLKNRVPKFGNDHPGVDTLRAAITRYVYDALRKQQGPFGGGYIPGEVIFVAHEWNGLRTGATPDGRRCGEVLADSAGSSQGADRNGPTALMRSMQRIPIDGMITSVVLNLKFHRPFVEQNPGAMAALLKGYFAADGQQMQINVCDTAELEDAFAHPERHQNLVVRVGGYSDYFVRLNERLQKEIIARSYSVV
jgi:pyruvate-formate lyase